MPAKSKAQQRLMGAAAGDRAVARKLGISQEKAREMARKPKGKKLPERKRAPSKSFSVSKRNARTGKPAKKFSLFKAVRRKPKKR